MKAAGQVLGRWHSVEAESCAPLGVVSSETTPSETKGREQHLGLASLWPAARPFSHAIQPCKRECQIEGFWAGGTPLRLAESCGPLGVVSPATTPSETKGREQHGLADRTAIQPCHVRPTQAQMPERLNEGCWAGTGQVALR